MPTLIDISNTETDYFKILNLSHTTIRKNGAKLYFYHCVCKSCGCPTVVRNTYLRNGHTKSCGCLLKKSQSQHKDWKGIGELSSARFSEIIASAKKRNLPFEIDIKFAWELFLKQKGLCALTGLPMKMGSKNKDRGTASLDRINNALGYTPKNVRWVLTDVNFMKRVFSDDDLLFYCKKILEYSKSQRHLT